MTSQPEPGQALSVGVVVADTYQVTRLLGRGGMGSVWEASHLRLPGKRVAIKVLHADVAADQEALARFKREAEIASRLGHPNIVEVHDFNSLPGGQPYLVLELLIGESLDARLRRAPVSLDNAMRIAGQIGAALSAAHREQVVHRDLKPQNVFLARPRVEQAEGDSGELVKVLDFGISKIRGSQTIKTLDSTILGTPQYMAPEQATGNHAQVDQRTDVFALGAIVYEMLAGRPAFSGQSIPEVVFKVVYELQPPLADVAPGVPRRVVQAVERALAKNQDERFPDVVSFVEQMAGVSISTLRRSPLSLAPPASSEPDPADPLAHTVDSSRREIAPPPEPHTPPPEPRRRRAWPLIAALLVVLIAGGATIALLARSGEETAGPPARAASEPRPEPERTPDLAPQATGPADPDPLATPGESPGTSEPSRPRRPRKRGDRRQTRPPIAEQAGAEEAAAEGGAMPPSIGSGVRAALVEGERALRDADYRQALVLAERALRHGAGPAAHALRALASCGIGDLGNANASFARIPRRNAILRRRVLGFCTRNGLELAR